VADRFVNDRNELFSVASDGSSPPLQLNAPLPAGADVDTEFLLSPDGQWVVALAEQLADNVRELFRIPVDGSAPPVRVSGALAAGGNVTRGTRFAPDGATLVYRADALADERFELFAVALEGGTPPVKLSGTLVADGDVQADFAFTPGGTHVVYRADAESDERFELYVAALDGSAGPTKISPPLVAEGDVRAGFVLTLDGSRVVFCADRDADEKVELLSTPLAGGPTLTLNAPLPRGGVVLETLQLGPDGKRVFFVADQRVDDVFELFSAPIDRAKSPTLHNPTLIAGGDVVLAEASLGTFAPTPDGSGVVYLADQELDGVVELYLSILAGAPAAERARAVQHSEVR